MDAVHLHLILNHIPVLGTLFAAGLLAYSLMQKAGEVKHAALAIALLAGASAIPAFVSGDEAEERIEKTSSGKQAERFIETHEDAAKIALGSAIATGVLALVALILAWRSGEAPDWSRNVVLALSVVGCVLMTRAANTGGQIAHAEIRSGISGIAAGGDNPADVSGTKNKNDDD